MLRLLSTGGVYREVSLADQAAVTEAGIQALAGLEDFALPGGASGSSDPDEPPATARYDTGRWLADCPNPDCNSAEAVDPDDPRFYCFSCRTQEAWADVIFPEDVAAIEAGLAELPLSEQNWTPE